MSGVKIERHNAELPENSFIKFRFDIIDKETLMYLANRYLYNLPMPNYNKRFIINNISNMNNPELEFEYKEGKSSFHVIYYDNCEQLKTFTLLDSDYTLQWEQLIKIMIPSLKYNGRSWLCIDIEEGYCNLYLQKDFGVLEDKHLYLVSNGRIIGTKEFVEKFNHLWNREVESGNMSTTKQS